MRLEPTRQELGKRGEKAAVSFLQKKGYQILEINYRNRLGEIDIIARYQKTICFVEVKTRQSIHYGSPYEAVTKIKQRKIIKIAQYYLSQNNAIDVNIRFDVVAIYLSPQGQYVLDLLENAFNYMN